jgi:DNA-binding MarR family transcriptional regulator
MREGLDRLEGEMLLLARRIESSARQSTLFKRMDRAAYLIARSLDADGPSTVVELARRLDLDASTVTRQVAAMEGRGQAARKVHPVDGRAWNIVLTAAGRKEMKAISERRHERFTEWVGDWSDGDVEQFSLLLQRFNASINAKPTDAAVAAQAR